MNDLMTQKPHPLREVFKEHKVGLSQVARFAGCGYNFMSNIMTGLRDPSPSMEKRLWSLAVQLKERDNQ